MYNLIYSKKFKKAYKKIKKTDQSYKKLIDLLYLLQRDSELDPKYKKHKLHGEFKNCFECHVTPDLLLIYKKKDQQLEILLLHLGSHPKLFK